MCLRLGLCPRGLSFCSGFALTALTTRLQLRLCPCGLRYALAAWALPLRLALHACSLGFTRGQSHCPLQQRGACWVRCTHCSDYEARGASGNYKARGASGNYKARGASGIYEAQGASGDYKAWGASGGKYEA
jgi:hypothetical protein